MIYLTDTSLPWLVDENKSILEQFESISEFKINTPAKGFLTKKSKFLLPLLEYAYDLDFDEKPDYERLKFLFKKILIEKDYPPTVGFEWSLRQGVSFDKINPDDNNSNISSCDIKSCEEAFDESSVTELRSNILKSIYEYSRIKNPNY